MKANRVINQQEQFENVDATLWQYIETAFDLMDKILGLMELRKELLRREETT